MFKTTAVVKIKNHVPSVMFYGQGSEELNNKWNDMSSHVLEAIHKDNEKTLSLKEKTVKALTERLSLNFWDYTFGTKKYKQIEKNHIEVMSELQEHIKKHEEIDLYYNKLQVELKGLLESLNMVPISYQENNNVVFYVYGV